jgi:hypothetical protein
VVDVTVVALVVGGAVVVGAADVDVELTGVVGVGDPFGSGDADARGPGAVVAPPAAGGAGTGPGPGAAGGPGAGPGPTGAGVGRVVVVAGRAVVGGAGGGGSNWAGDTPGLAPAPKAQPSTLPGSGWKAAAPSVLYRHAASPGDAW